MLPHTPSLLRLTNFSFNSGLQCPLGLIDCLHCRVRGVLSLWQTFSPVFRCSRRSVIVATHSDVFVIVLRGSRLSQSYSCGWWGPPWFILSSMDSKLMPTSARSLGIFHLYCVLRRLQAQAPFRLPGGWFIPAYKQSDCLFSTIFQPLFRMPFQCTLGGFVWFTSRLDFWSWGGQSPFLDQQIVTFTCWVDVLTDLLPSVGVFSLLHVHVYIQGSRVPFAGISFSNGSLG